MVLIVDHYERLGIASNATREQIRTAYRDLARRNHPDVKGESSAVRMAEINEAWRVLSDPDLRAVYDHTMEGRVSSGPAMHAWAAERQRASRVQDEPLPPPVTPARFPWRFMLVLATLGISFVVVNAALTKPGSPAVPDNLIQTGSCVDIAGNGDAVEVPCDGLQDGLVDSFRAADRICPHGTEEHRDRQGMGPVCVRLTGNGG